MNVMEGLFSLAVLLIFYTYVGYAGVLYLMVAIKRRFNPRKQMEIGPEEWPEIAFVVPAFNERTVVDQKVRNTRSLDYPKDKLRHIWITDGSSDGTPEHLRTCDDVLVLHEDARRGKTAAMNRAMTHIHSPIVVFSDANTLLGEDALIRMARQFADPTVGCVSGEKRIADPETDAAAGAGEGLYWRYESTLKRWDAELNSAMGCAGELFALRSELFETVEEDTLLDDFMISMRIAMKGYRIAYDPMAYAQESASAGIGEELKRKVRIAAGGIQSMVRLAPLLNVFRYGLFTFQYLSHRVLRWTVTPFLLPLVFVANAFLAGGSKLYATLFVLQLLFYLIALLGWGMRNQTIRIKGFFVPFYFLVMNYAVWAGAFRYFQKGQTVLWEKAKRGIESANAQ